MVAPTLNSQADKDYYTILGVAQTATNDEIKSAFRKLALKHHPDKGGNREDFENVKQAEEVLTDASRRHAYDNMLKDKASTAFRPKTRPAPPQYTKKRSDEEPSAEPAVKTPEQDSGHGTRVFVSLYPLQDVKAEFDKFVKEMMADFPNSFALEMGFAAEMKTDPATGQQMLMLQFPDEKTANHFIDRLVELGMIDANREVFNPSELAKYRSPTPFDTDTPRLDKDKS